MACVVFDIPYRPPWAVVSDPFAFSIDLIFSFLTIIEQAVARAKLERFVQYAIVNTVHNVGATGPRIGLNLV